MDKLINSLIENPELAKEIIQEMTNQYKPLLYLVGNELLKVYKDFADNLEYPATVAKNRMNQYKAYIDVGFSEDQAMMLMINDIKSNNEQIKKSMSNMNVNKK